MAIKKFKIEASEQAKQLAKKPVKASDGDWDTAVIRFMDTIPNLPEQGKVISKTYKGFPIVIVGLGNGKCLYHSYLQKANAASDIQFIRGLIKRGDAPEKAVENLGFKAYTRSDVEGACGGKKSVKSAAKRSVKCAETNADLERAKQNIVDGYYDEYDGYDEYDKDYIVDEYFADEDLNRVPILYTTIGDTDEHEYQLYADLINPKIIVEIDGKTIYEDKFPSIGALADDLEDFDWDNWYSYYLRYVPDEIVYGDSVNSACGGKKSVKAAAGKKRWGLYSDFGQRILNETFDSKREAQKAFREYGYTKDSEAWIEEVDETAVGKFDKKPANSACGGKKTVKAGRDKLKARKDWAVDVASRYSLFNGKNGDIENSNNKAKLIRKCRNMSDPAWVEDNMLSGIIYNNDAQTDVDNADNPNYKPKKKSVKSSARRPARKTVKASKRSRSVKAAKEDNMNKEAHKWYNISLTKDEYAKFRKFLKENGYKYEPSEEGQNTYVKVYLTKADADKVNKFLDSMDDVESACGGKKSKKTVKASAAAKRRAKKSVKASKYYEITDHYNDEVGRADTEDEARELAKKLVRENDVDHYDIFWVDTDPDSTDDTSYIDTVYADKPFSVEGYFETKFRGLSDSDTFYELRDALDYAQELLGKGLSVRMECENAGGRLEITPDEYDEFVQTSDGALFEDMPEVAEWLHQVQVERMDSYQEPWLDNWQYNTDIGMSMKYAKRGKKPVKADFNDIEDIEDFYDGENFDNTKALGAFNSDTAPYDVNTTVAEYITDNYGIYAENVSYVEYNGPGDWVVDMSQSGQAVADDFVYFFSEKDYDLSLKLYGESETDASGYDMAKYYGDSAIHGNDFQFQFYPAQNQWSAPQVDVDINELIQIGLTQEEANRVVDLVAEYEQNYISICQDINYYIESFLKELSEEEVKASTGVKAALGNKNKTDYASNPIYELDKYVKDLAEGVAAAAGITLTYQVSDEAITFIDGDGTAVFIQPISEITPEPDDLENDIQELVSAIQYEDSDNPEYWPTDTTEDDPDYATRAVQMSVDDELEPVMGEGEDIGYGIDSYGETIDESTVNELYRMAERDILPKTELAKIDPYVSIDEDSWDFYFGGVSNTGMMGVVKFYIHFKLTSDNIDLNEFVIPEARLYPDFKYYTASLDFDIYTENGKVTDVVLESADIYKSDNSYDTYQSDKFKEAFNVEAIENYIEKLAAPAAEEIYNAVSNL